MGMEGEDLAPTLTLLGHLVDSGELSTSQTSKVGRCSFIHLGF